MMKNVFVSLCMVLTMVIASSCASTKNAATVADISGEWNIIELNGAAVVPAPGQAFPFIGFDVAQGTVYGNSGCNRMTGRFDVNAKPGTIDLGALGSTRMMCPDMTVEKNVLAALSQVKKYKKLGDDQIALCGSSKRPIAVLQKRPATVTLNDLSGKWLISEVSGVAVPDSLENKPFLEFNVAEKRLHGNAGCNVINGGIQTEDANSAAVSFPQVIITMMACPDMKIESSILKALDSVRSFGKLANGGVGFYNAENTLVLVLTKE